MSSNMLAMDNCLRIGWLGVPSTDVRDLTAVANSLFNYSKKEYWRRNVVLAELAITIQEFYELKKH